MAQELIVLPQMHFNERVKHQYSNVPAAIAREIIQNSSDAGATQVDFTLDANGFTASDDGHGMTLEDFRAYYLTLGGTKKKAGSIGMFGAAKELLSFAWQSWSCTGQGFTCSGSYALPPESSTQHGTDQGFIVSARDPSLDHNVLLDELKRVVGLSKLPCKVTVGGEEIPQGRRLRSNQEVIAWDFGTLYVHKSNPRGYEQTGRLYVRAGGLLTTHDYVGGDYVWYLELTQASDEVLTENRDALRWQVKEKVQAEVAALIKSPARIEKRSHAKITVYGAYVAAASVYTDGGTFGVECHETAELWRKPFAVAEENCKGRLLYKGELRKSLSKALHVWSAALNMVADMAGLSRPIPGLYFGKQALALHTNLGTDDHAICAKPEVLKRHPFEILEIAMHELAHYERADHSQEFERVRLEIAAAVASGAVAILDTIDRLQSQKM
jgi:hypothetical protein